MVKRGRYLYFDVDPFLFYVVCEYDSQVQLNVRLCN